MPCGKTVPYSGKQYACTARHRLACGEWMHSNRDDEQCWVYWHYDQHGEPVVVTI